MNAGHALVRCYLGVNGYFVESEVPVIRKARDQGWEQITDVDILALRFPRSRHLVSRGRPGPDDDLVFASDPALEVPADAMDLIIGEVKEGSADINPALRSSEALHTVIARFGCCPREEIDRVVDDLRRDGEARIAASGSVAACRFRLIAFGRGEAGRRSNFTVLPLKRIAEFLDRHLEEHHSILHPADLADPVLGLLHLLKKIG